VANADRSEKAGEPAPLRFEEALTPARSASPTALYASTTENQKPLVMQSSTQEQVMSAISRLIIALGWGSPRGQDSCWGERPPLNQSDRRASPRHPTSPNEAYIGWWAGERFHSVAGQFRDISSSGVLILTREEPPIKHVWIGLVRPAKTRWCPTRVVRVRETSTGLIEIGLAFEAACDSDLFKRVLQRNYRA